VQFEGTSLKKASFVGANLNRANFRGASLEKADFSEAISTEASFCGAHLSNAKFLTTSLNGAYFGTLCRDDIVTEQGAKVSKADFTGADISKSTWSGAKGKGRAIFDDVTAVDVEGLPQASSPPPPSPSPPHQSTPMCSKCAWNAKKGYYSCCSSGGAWEGKCGGSLEYDWEQGVDACK